ncbi:DUF6879 family protein [Nocardia sp. CA-128927]|uniref:DUF6879 family protein n=1 Tax=Nocardia sp. CA-128927 TaxID=3239975 RepID=UPI003D967057
MQLVGDDGFKNLLQSCEREAFHLELLDSYAEPNEHEPFRRFLEDEPDDHMWFQPWMDLVRETTGRGVAVTRTRIVSVPHTDYTRFSLAVAELNARAGEDIRYLPRHLAEDVPPDDFWLFDDQLVIFSAFGGSNAWSGAVTVDTNIVGYCQQVKERFWPLSIPYSTYVTT